MVMRSKLGVGLVMVAIAACSKREPAPPEPTAPTAPAAVAVTAVAADAARGPATRLGPFDLTARTLDLAQLFPGKTIEARDKDTIVVRDGAAVIAELAHHDGLVTHIDAYGLKVEPNGLASGATTKDLAALAPDANCGNLHDDALAYCSEDRDISILYVIPRDRSYDRTPIAEVDQPIKYVQWIPMPPDVRPRLASVPPLARKK